MLEQESNKSKMALESVTEQEKLYSLRPTPVRCRTNAQFNDQRDWDGDGGLQRLIEFAPEGIAVHQNDSLVYANHTALEQYGVKDQKELQGYGMHGFVEPGESLEDSIRREVYEETNVRVGAVHYHSSQPWPFPSSLMLGFIAEATSTEILLNDRELEDTRWFTREELRSDFPKLPFRISIARRLVDHWIMLGDGD